MKVCIRRLSFLIATTLIFILPSNGQNLDLPAKSPAASLSYTVGLTKIEISYSSPAVKEREIWGKLVPYDQVWRAGANEATTISFSTDVNVEGNEIDAGEYSFFLIPKKGDKWTAILNSNTKQWGTNKYDKSKDVARFEVSSKMSNVKQERLVYEIVDQSMEQGYIKMAWGKARVYLRFFVDIVDQGMENVDAALEVANEDQKWSIYAQGAEFLLTLNKQMDQAMQWADASSELEERSYNWFLKARILAHKELYKEAIDTGKQAIEFGKTNPKDKYFFMNESQIRNTMKNWIGQIENNSE